MRARYKKKIFSFLLLLILFTPQKIWASDQLSEENIKSFYDKITALENGNEIESYIGFFEVHLHEHFMFTFNYPFSDVDGKTSDTYNKRETIESFLKNFKKNKNKTDYYTSILINEDKKSALVTNISKIPKEKEDIIQTFTKCVDKLIFNEQDITQIIETNCTISVSHKIDQLYE